VKAKVERISEDDGSLVAKDSVFTVHSATSVDEKPVEKGEIVDGFNFGSTIVPFSGKLSQFKPCPQCYFVSHRSEPNLGELNLIHAIFVDPLTRLLRVREVREKSGNGFGQGEVGEKIRELTLFHGKCLFLCILIPQSENLVRFLILL